MKWTDRYELQAKVIKALAHPVRLLIVDALADRSLCVCELTALAEMQMPAVSKHLSILKDAGVVNDEKKGLNVYYHLRMPCLTKLLGCVEAEAKKHLQQQLQQIK